ncbi:MAG: hypothetical protein QF521_10400 [Alphaproteobacteria bacterium]|nr:hypothetical protein [Alphaproteobacteria bacterium]
MASAEYIPYSCAEAFRRPRAHPRDPGTISTHIGVLQIWGRKPG